MATKTNTRTNRTNDRNPEFDVRVIRYNPYTPKKGKKTSLLGFVTISINGVAISGVKHLTGKNGDYIAFPSEAVGDEYYPTVWLDLGETETNRVGYAAVLESVLAYLEDQEEV